MKVADFHEDWDQDVGYQHFVDYSGYLVDAYAQGDGWCYVDVDDDDGFSQNGPLCAVHHSMHEHSPNLRSLGQIENHHAIRNLDPLYHGLGH